MRKELSEHHFPPLSTRMIFLHHRVRMHDSAVRHDHQAREHGAPKAFAAWAALMLLLAAAMLLGGLYA